VNVIKSESKIKTEAEKAGAMVEAKVDAVDVKKEDVTTDTVKMEAEDGKMDIEPIKKEDNVQGGETTTNELLPNNI
jgi:hypothetical protein